ncbi:MAG: TlpA family protein disulfide reductase [Anaerolineales bacterium]|nr:TlpA family protein disulfide reductase [Anaerolineales bacterium]
MMSEKQVNQPSEPQEQAQDSPRWGRILVWGGLLLLLGLLALGLMRAQQPVIEIGSRAPDYVLTTFDGNQIDSRDLAGKVVVINFWASWCKPCEQEAPDLETAWRYYQPGGEVVFLGVDYVDTEPEAMAYLEKFDITFPNGPDLGTRISQAFNRKMGVPETYIIDQDGILRYIKIGPFLSVNEITAVINPLLTP